MNQQFDSSSVSGGLTQIWRRFRYVGPVRLALLLCFGGAAVSVCATGLPPFNTLPSPQASFVAPARLATDGQSHLLVSDPLAGKVVVLNAAGVETSVKPGLGQPLGLAVDQDGKIYVGDATAGTVRVFDSQWNLLSQLGQGPGEFQLPGHITTLTESNVTTVYVSDGRAHQVKAYRNNALVGQYGGYGMGPNQFNFPAGIWVGTNGHLYVVDQNNDRVQVLDRTGNFLRWFTLQPAPEQVSFSGRAQGIAGDNAGWLYVADTFQGHVKVFNLSGTFLGYVGGYGENAGELRSPGGVIVDGSGRLWVANANNGRVEGFLAVQTPPILLWNRTAAGSLVLTWNDPRFDLQAAADLNGPWQTVAGTSPTTIPASTVRNTPKQYFRLLRY
ncbi:MAG: hypothetical protein HOP33_20640 [Verrucomicrobia bacterium]|nr:hypothetical protein [Verrucomicrobiota bacterium]